MTRSTSVLLLDDGELDRVQTILQELDADYLRLKGREIARSLPAPLDLLVSSGRRALNDMPRIEPGAEGAPAFTWVCLHNQDFLPLRQRLRELGVNFLVQAALDQESLRLLLTQLLYRGAERRAALRLPLGGEVVVRVDSVDQRARLAELSRTGCRIQTSLPLAVGVGLRVLLPAALSGGEELELPCRVLRRAEAPGRAGTSVCSAVLGFEALVPEAAAQLEALASGRQIGTRLTPLAERPGRAGRTAAPRSPASQPEVEIPAEPDSAGPEPVLIAERRGEPRVSYPGRVQASAATARRGSAWGAISLPTASSSRAGWASAKGRVSRSPSTAAIGAGSRSWSTPGWCATTASAASHCASSPSRRTSASTSRSSRTSCPRSARWPTTRSSSSPG